MYADCEETYIYKWERIQQKLSEDLRHQMEMDYQKNFKEYKRRPEATQ